MIAFDKNNYRYNEEWKKKTEKNKLEEEKKLKEKQKLQPSTSTGTGSAVKKPPPAPAPSAPLIGGALGFIKSKLNFGPAAPPAASVVAPKPQPASGASFIPVRLRNSIRAILYSAHFH